MVKVKMTCKMCGDIFYDINQIVELDEGTAKAWVNHGVAIYVDDIHSVATKLEPPDELHPKAKVEVIEVNKAVEPMTTKTAKEIIKPKQPVKPIQKPKGKKR